MNVCIGLQPLVGEFVEGRDLLLTPTQEGSVAEGETRLDFPPYFFRGFAGANRSVLPPAVVIHVNVPFRPTLLDLDAHQCELTIFETISSTMQPTSTGSTL
ncbi:MAG TPA: hypothetical protein VEI52_16865 [Terriglobales bacterium]|nr:hypothetical protein [Terriglobales bacterium]